MSRPRVLIAPSHLPDIEVVYGPTLRAAGCDLVYPPRPAQMTEAELLATLPGCAASLAGSEPYTRRVIAAAAAMGLRIIARAGVGYDGVDVAAATDHGVLVTYAPGTNHEAVGETALMLILALAKRLVHQHTQIQQGHWPRVAYQPVRGKTLGVVGLGRTGKATATRALAFGMHVVATDPAPDAAFAAAHGIPFVPLGVLLAQSDYVTLHVPLTADTRRLVRAETLARMKPTAFLVNCARGEVVDEADLHAALTTGRLAGAGLDVFEREPPGASPLTRLPNVVLTAHTAGVDLRSRDDMARVPAEAIATYLSGGRPPAEWVVNAEALPAAGPLRTD